MTQGSSSFGTFLATDLCATRQWSGGDMPKGWRKLGLKPVDHDYTLLKQSHRQSKSSLYKNGAKIGEAYTHQPQQMPMVPSATIPANVRLEAWSRLATKIRSHDFDASVFAGESLLAAQLVTRTLLSLAQACRYCRQGNWEAMVRSLARSYSGPPRDRGRWQRALNRGDLGAALLAVRYGWEPLLSDILEAVKAWDALWGGKTVTFRASCTVREKSVWPASLSDASIDAIDAYSCHVKVELREKLSATRSLGLLSPLPVVWELIPFSFILDWFIPVGAWLSEWSFFNGLDARYVETQKIVRDSHVSKRATWSDASWPRANGVVGGDWKSSGIKLQRRVLTSMPLIGLEPKKMSQALSRKHLENAAALVASITSGRGREYYLGRGS